MLDRIIASGNLSSLAHDTERIQLANQFQIPYEHKPHFDQCLQGLFKFRHHFTGSSELQVAEHDSSLMSYPGIEIRHTTIYDLTAGQLVEPVYSYYMPEHHLPFHSIAGAMLRNWGTTDIKVRMISLCSEEGFENVGQYHVTDEMRQLLVDSLDEEKIKVGHGCTSCPKQDCRFNEKFDALMYAWMKSKQYEEGLRDQIREHLVYHGPTKVGAHLVYMKEHRRRSLPRKHFPAFLEFIQARDPNGHMNYLTSSTAAVFEAVEKGKLPKEVLSLFTQSRYYTVETGLSL